MQFAVTEMVFGADTDEHTVVVAGETTGSGLFEPSEYGRPLFCILQFESPVLMVICTSMLFPPV